MIAIAAVVISRRDASDAPPEGPRKDPTAVPPAGSGSQRAPHEPFLGDWKHVKGRPSPESTDPEADQQAIARALDFAKAHGLVLQVKPGGHASLSDGSGKTLQEYTWVTRGDVVHVELLRDNGGPPIRPYEFTLSLAPDETLIWEEGSGSAMKGAVHTLRRKR